MGTLPHTSTDRAMHITLGLDIPFWPQLPAITYYEDMFVQFARGFPGVEIDTANEKIKFHLQRFEEELVSYAERAGNPDEFALDKNSSLTYSQFLQSNLDSYYAVRGHVTGPINLGFQIMDDDGRPIIYNDEVRGLLFYYLQKTVNIQYRQLSSKNSNAFVWLDDPGFWWVFSGMTGYNDVLAKNEYLDFLDGIEGPRAVHLCVNINLPYLVDLGLDILSFDAYHMEIMPAEYARSLGVHFDRGGVVSWGIVPTESATLNKESPETLATKLTGFWNILANTSGIDIVQIAEQSMLAPARCCLRNPQESGPLRKQASMDSQPDSGNPIEETLVEKAFSYLKDLSSMFRDIYAV